MSGVYLPGIREFSFVIEEAQALHSLAVRTLDHIVGEVDEQLGEAAFRGGIITKDRREGCIP